MLEYLPAENRFLVRAGVGWEPGVVGVASIGADLASPAGFALKTGRPVISNHLEIEERFRTPELLVRHGIHRAMNVILQGDGRPFGVLEVDSRSDDEFVEHDLAFLQGAANILGMAIERERHERNLKAALERHQFLIGEMNHRVKNSLALVAACFASRLAKIADPAFARAARRRDPSRGAPSLGCTNNCIKRPTSSVSMSEDTSKPFARTSAPASRNARLSVEAQPGIVISADRAISVRADRQ